MQSKKILSKHTQLVTTLIKHHFGNKRIRIVPLTGGISNDVFHVRTGNEDLVVRMSEEGGKFNSFLKEQWAVARAKEVGIPVPEILEVGNTVIPLAYMISRKIDGTEATNHLERGNILQELGRFAAIIHTIPTKNYGNEFDWSQNLLSKNDTWKEYLHKELNVVQRLQILEKNKMLTTETIKKIEKQLKVMEAWKNKPCLHHGDLRLKNLLVDKAGNIIAVIDWENCISSIPPYWDISIALHDLSIDKQGYFLEGYELNGKKMVEFSPAIKVFNILNYAPEIERMVREKQKGKLEHYRARLHGALDMFSLD